MAADLDILLREVDEVKDQLARNNGVDVDSNAIFESLEQNVHRKNRVEFVVRQFLGEDQLNEFGRRELDNSIEEVAIVNGGAETIDLTIDVIEKKTPLLDINGTVSLGELVTNDVINLDSESYSSDSSVELLTKNTSKGAKVKRKLETTAIPKSRKKNKNCFDSNLQGISSELSKDASASNSEDTTYDLCDVNNNDPNNNIEPESSFQQTGAHSVHQPTGELQSFPLPSTSEVDINAPSCSYQPAGSTNASYRCTPEEDFPSDDDGDTLQLNNEDLPDQEDIRDELLREARFIHNLVPHQHLDEIFSYLEANLDSEDRMNVVLLHFLQRDKQRDDGDQQKEVPSLSSTATFSEKASTAAANCINSQMTMKKTDIEPLAPYPDGSTNTYSAEVEIYSISDAEPPAIKRKMDTVIKPENVTSADDISKTQVPNRICTSTLLDLPNKTLKVNEENEVLQKYIDTLTEMFPNMPKQLVEQHCQEIVYRGDSLEGLILELLETHSKSEVKEIPPEENLATEVPEKQSAIENGSAVSVISCEEQEEEEEVEELRYKTLLAIFPDADPEFLREKASTLPQDDESFRNFIITNLELKGYPSLKDYEQRQERAAIKKKYSEEFSVQAFLEVFPDPLNYFKERKSSYNEKRKYYGVNYLKNKFRWLRMEILKEVYHKHECNLTKAFEELQTIQNSRDKKKRSREFRASQRLAADYPKIDELDVPFLQELFGMQLSGV